MLTLVLALSAFVCPPIEIQLAARNIGEECGGTCQTLGECAPGLECHAERLTTSPMSFAILMGGAKKAGVCRKRLDLVDGDRRQLAGGLHDADIQDAQVAAAAKWGVATLMSRSNSLTPPTLTRVISAKSQVVAGIKYLLTIEFSDGSQHAITVVDQAWMTPRYSLVSDEIVAFP